MEKPAAVKEAVQAVHDLPVVDRVAGRRPERSWQLARPIVDAAMLGVACFAAAHRFERPRASLLHRRRASSSSPSSTLDVPRRYAELYAPQAPSRAARGRPRGRRARRRWRRWLFLRSASSQERSADLAAQTVRPWAFATAYVAAGRIALHWSRAQACRHGESMRPTLIVGAGASGACSRSACWRTPSSGSSRSASSTRSRSTPGTVASPFRCWAPAGTSTR